MILLDGFEYFSLITYFVAKLCPIWIHRPSLCRSKGRDDRPKTLTERTFIEEIRFDYLQTHRLKHSKGDGNTLYVNGISIGTTWDRGCLCGSLHCKITIGNNNDLTKLQRCRKQVFNKNGPGTSDSSKP